MANADENQSWVICPVCYQPSPAGKTFCEHCWGAIIPEQTPLTSPELRRTAGRRKFYIIRKKLGKAVAIGFIPLAILAVAFFLFSYSTDTIFKPPQDLTSSSLPGEWAMFRHDLSRSGNAGTDGILPQGKLKWLFPTGAAVHSSPAVADGIVYFGSQNDKFYALDANTGVKLWEYETGSWVESSPAVAGGVVYFGSNDGRLYALDARSGEKLWDFRTGYPIQSSPAVADGVVYFGAGDWNLYAVDAVEGTELWSFNIQTLVLSSPVVANGIIYIGAGNGYIYALDARNGRQRLQFLTPHGTYSSPAVKDGIVYFTTSNGALYAVQGNARTWAREHLIRPLWTHLWLMGLLPKPPLQSGFLWATKIGRTATSSPVVVGNLLYTAADDTLLAADLQSRQTLWKFKTGGGVESSPAIAGSAVFVGSKDGRLYAVDAASGEKLWDFSTGDEITSSPAVANGVVYIGSHDGNLYAIE
ncbi:MAG: PQQ-binding-like beta-propeller repeat protein [Dehalococcoidales bacterium]|nr:PQQ-binding-like beta-propeller repeat protein [Dehalococcoidales bacterium]